jgi:hypothetical protein
VLARPGHTSCHAPGSPGCGVLHCDDALQSGALMNPGDVIGNYRIVRLLGQGGMGSVFEAIHETIERRVALKVLHDGLANDSEAMNRFFNEARATNRIDHPSIVQVSDFGHTPQGAGFLVMEFLRGCSLAKRINDLNEHRERMDVASALQIAWQVADALAVAHGVGIVHRGPFQNQKPSRNRDFIGAEKTAGKLGKIRGLGLVLDGSEQSRAFIGAHCA